MKLIGLLLPLGIVLIGCAKAELIESNDIEKFCYPEEYKNSRKSCECSNESAPPWGMRAVKIDCSYKSLKSTELSEVLPLYVDTLDLSWNSMDVIPAFSSDSLRLLNLMHNNITIVKTKNFIKISNVRELYLSWNSIQSLEQNAFDQLAHLQTLDLSHNNLHVLSLQLFSPMLVLESLSLSWNRQLNQSEGIQELDFYQTYGLNMKLHTLTLKACNLNNIVLSKEAGLQTLDLRRNSLRYIPKNLPSTLEKLDLSDNLFESLNASETGFISQIKELYIEDMPRMTRVEENAFVPLESLEKVSFQNCRRLNSFHAHAFGVKSSSWPALKSMSLRGTSMRTFNDTLFFVFHKLLELDLNGLPLHCDCQLSWLREVPLETHGRCFRPSRLRGMLLTNVRASDFSCDTWPSWVYGIIILSLIILFVIGIYVIVRCLRPNKGVQMRRKVGAGSPYARVTIEPNRQESNYY